MCVMNDGTIIFLTSLQARNQDFFRAWGVFLELGHLDKHSPTTQEKKAPQGKDHQFFCQKTLNIFILNEKFYPKMITIRAFFLQIRALFPNFRKRAWETSPSLL